MTTPLYTTAEAARALGVPAPTFSTWAKGYSWHPKGRKAVSGDPIVTCLPVKGRGQPCIPYIGLAEGLVLAAIRRSGVPLQRIRPALAILADEMGVEHALASRRLYTDGAELLFDVADRFEDAEGTAQSIRDLVVLRSGQRVFTDVIAQYLQQITYDEAGFAKMIRLPQYAQASVVVDPARSFGQPIFSQGGARIADVLERFWAGEDLAEVADDYGVPLASVEDVVRVASQRAA